MEKITFENLPSAVSQLYDKLGNIERLLLQQSNEQQPETDKFLTIQQASEILHLSVPTLYSKNSRGELPGVCKRGKRLYFSKQVLLEYIESGRKKSNSEIEAEAVNSLSAKK